MERRWDNKNVDLELLTAYIGEFLKKKDFEAVKGQIPSGYQIFAENSPQFKLNGYISIAIEGKPNDFTVKLELCRAKKRNPIEPVLLTTMFFGGYLLKRRLKSEEDWIKFKKEFWMCVENAVLHLSNSSTNVADL
ncbi:MAG: hypothetical protein QXH91_01085 [Candidatus Bathyarchaeia archaeon]